jgi:GNAT superfamily N-acetyltransferase
MRAGLSIRQATPADTPTVVELWNEAKDWLAAQGLDQWQYPIKMHNVDRAIDARLCWLVEPRNGSAVATITLEFDADLSLWRPAEMPDEALYVHRLVVRRSKAHQNLGAEILDWADDQVRTAGRTFLRLDAWTNNVRLHEYYRCLGFRLVRIVDHPSGSGALFERPVSDQAANDA